MAPALRHRHADRVFERLYRAHVRDVYRYALAVTGNPADAEDVAQTTFMNAYRALERGERPAKPHHWLIVIAHNVCRQRFRQASRRPAEVHLEEDAAEALVPNEEAPTAADIQRALGHLPLNQREALVMRELEGRPNAEIADLLGLSLSAVEALLFRARRALREQLEGDLTCLQAEAAISRQLDGHLPLAEAGVLRAHLRECEECRHLARRQCARRRGWKALATAPLPTSLASWGFEGGAATVGAGAAVKVAAVAVAAVVAGGGGYAVVKDETSILRHPAASQASAVTAAGTHGTTRKTGSPGAAARRKHLRQAGSRAGAGAGTPATATPVTAALTGGAATIPAQAGVGRVSRARVPHSRQHTVKKHAHKTVQHARTPVKPAHSSSAPSTPDSASAHRTPTLPASSCKAATSGAAHGRTSTEPTPPVDQGTSIPCAASNAAGTGDKHAGHP
jgi:RNA polymerase sigma factor (sigma-70 family)